MSDPTKATSKDTRSLEVYYARRLKKIAGIGTNPGKHQWWHNLVSSEKPLDGVAIIQSPQESTVVKPHEMLPLLSGFKKPYALEIFKSNKEQIYFQIAFNKKDKDSIANLRALFGSHLNVNTITRESWNHKAGLGEKNHVEYLLPVSSLYPMSFTLNWTDADIVNLVLEKLKTYKGQCLIQFYVEPLDDSGLQISTDILASLNYLTRLLEKFRQGLIQKRFNEPLTMFSLRMLGNKQPIEAITKSLCVLNAQFNHFKKVNLGGKEEKTAKAILERKKYLSDGMSIISMPELAGLWHLDIKPDFYIEKAQIREVATARIEKTEEHGRILGYHTLRGATYPVILPYKARNNHMCCFGKSQSGKSTALIRISTHDIEEGMGVAFVDQHDLSLRVLPHIPKKRWKDVILISPRQMKSGYMFPLNLFDIGKDAFAIEFVCETLKEILSRAFTAESIGPRTSYILDIATTALLKDPRPDKTYTVLDLSHVLLDKNFRHDLANRLRDEDISEKLLGFDRLPRDSFAAPLNKLQLFSRDSIRPMLASPENGFNTFKKQHKSLLDAKPIIVCDLADIPHASAVVIGSIVLAMLQLESFKRNPQEENELFNCYVDEAAAFLNMENQDLITRTFQECAKFRMSLTLINQSYDTIPSKVRKTLSTNVAALMYFSMGIGSGDAKIAQAELHNEFKEEELNAIPVGRAAVRIGSDVFSVYSPDFKTPQNGESEELTEYALKNCGERIPHTAEQARQPIPQSQNRDKTTTPHTKEGTCNKEIGNTSYRTKKPKVELSKLQGQTKRKAIIKMLSLSGLVPLKDLNDIFFPDSPSYGRQFLKRMANEKDVQYLKLGKRLAYHTKDYELPEERLWEHSAMTGSIGARMCALASKRGAKLEMERETAWGELRPDLLVRWREDETSMTMFWEADRATESVATFRKEKLVPYQRAMENQARGYSQESVEKGWDKQRRISGGRKEREIKREQARNEEMRLIIVVPDKKRMEKLNEAVRDFPELISVTRFTTLKDWSVNADIFAEKLLRTPHNELVGV